MPIGPLLVVAAWPPELTRLRRRLARAPALRAGVELRAVGVGLIEAAVGAARAIDETGPRAIVLVGTAGRYAARSRALAIGTAAVVSRVRIASAAAATSRGYFPKPMPTELACDERLVAELGASEITVACPLAITSAVALARRIATTTGAELENLEAFAVAAAARAANVPFAAALGIANAVGPNAHAEWRAHGADAAAAACDVVARWLEVTAPSRSRRGR